MRKNTTTIMMALYTLCTLTLPQPCCAQTTASNAEKIKGFIFEIETYFGRSPEQIGKSEVFGSFLPYQRMVGRFGADQAYMFQHPQIRDTFISEIGFNKKQEAVYFVFRKRMGTLEFQDIEVQGLLRKCAMAGTWSDPKTYGGDSLYVSEYKAGSEADKANNKFVFMAILPNHKKQLIVFHPGYTPRDIDIQRLAGVKYELPGGQEVVALEGSDSEVISVVSLSKILSSQDAERISTLPDILRITELYKDLEKYNNNTQIPMATDADIMLHNQLLNIEKIFKEDKNVHISKLTKELPDEYRNSIKSSTDLRSMIEQTNPWTPY